MIGIISDSFVIEFNPLNFRVYSSFGELSLLVRISPLIQEPIFTTIAMYSSRQIANYFIKKSQASGQELTPMKLIKLCYIAHGWYLGLYGQQLLSEIIYAWKYGPVIDTIYKDFKQYGSNQITELLFEENQKNYPLPDNKIMPFLDAIWNAYGGFNAIELSAMTHEKGTPWDTVWNIRGGKNQQYAIIPNDIIEEHYKSKIAAENARTASTTPSIESTSPKSS